MLSIPPLCVNASSLFDRSPTFGNNLALASEPWVLESIFRSHEGDEGNTIEKPTMDYLRVESKTLDRNKLTELQISQQYDLQKHPMQFLCSHVSAYNGITPLKDTINHESAKWEDITEPLIIIPLNDIYPQPPPTCRTISLDTARSRDELWIKRPCRVFWRPDKAACLYSGFTIAESFLTEIRMYELLRQRQLLRFVQYHGVIIEQGFAVGMVLDRLSHNLQNHLPSLNEAQRRHVWSGVANTVMQLHTVGLAHNDLKPDNVLLTDTTMEQL